MMHMSGPEATEIIRKRHNFRNVILGVTGHAMPEDIVAFKRSGVDDVITKPLSFDVLFQALLEKKVFSISSGNE